MATLLPGVQHDKLNGIPTHGRLVVLSNGTKPNRKGVLEDDRPLLGTQAEGLGVTTADGFVLSETNHPVFVLICPKTERTE
jgi:hypothetical protein